VFFGGSLVGLIVRELYHKHLGDVNKTELVNFSGLVL